MCMGEGWLGRMGWTTVEAGGSHGAIVVQARKHGGLDPRGGGEGGGKWSGYRCRF